MKNNIYLLFIFINFSGCIGQPEVTISFDFNTSAKKLRVNFKNNSSSDLIILNIGRVKKIGDKHPCGATRLDDFTKISSHVEGDCNINRGSRLFPYQKMEPFDKTAYFNLRKELTAFHWFDERNDLFVYMDSTENRGDAFPSFILTKAGTTTFVEYAIDNSLSNEDSGVYMAFWARKEEIDEIISPRNNNRYKLGDVLFNLKEHKYYNGPLEVHPLKFNL
jgi:hypothetical protein